MKKVLISLSLLMFFGVIGFTRNQGLAEKTTKSLEAPPLITENESVLEDGADDSDIRSAMTKKYTQEEYDDLLEAIPEGYELVEGQITIE